MQYFANHDCLTLLTSTYLYILYFCCRKLEKFSKEKVMYLTIFCRDKTTASITGFPFALAKHNNLSHYKLKFSQNTFILAQYLTKVR